MLVVDIGYWTKVIRKILLLALAIAVILLGFKLAVYYIPFLIGIIISLMIEPLIKRVQSKTTLNRKTSAIIVLLFIFAILIGLIIWCIITVVTEASSLLQNLNTYISRIYEQIQGYIDGLQMSRINIPAQVVRNI